MCVEAAHADGEPDVDVIVDVLPRRLRAERERQGISVRELARRLGVSPSAISQIETGRARPSVSTLYAIVRELGLSLDELFASGPDDAPVAARRGRPSARPVVHTGDRKVIQLDTGVRWERLTAEPEDGLEFLHVVYDVGGSSSSEGSLMRHGGREYGVVLSGRLEVTVGFETYGVGVGDSISFDSTTPHRLRNAVDQPSTAIWVVVGRDADARTSE